VKRKEVMKLLLPALREERKRMQSVDRKRDEGRGAMKRAREEGEGVRVNRLGEEPKKEEAKEGKPVKRKTKEGRP